MPRSGQVLGLVGTNGIGKSTALNILSGKIKPNLGKYDVRLFYLSKCKKKIQNISLKHFEVSS